MSEVKSSIVGKNAPGHLFKEPIIKLVEFSQCAEKDKVGILLSIIELCSNPHRYKYDFSNKTVQFWKDALEEDHLKTIFNKIEAETLKKYWFNIRKCKNIEAFIFILCKNRKKINDSEKSISTIIEFVSSYVNKDIT